MNIDSLTIGDAKQLASLLGSAPKSCGNECHGLQVVVLDKGFVYVGETETDGNFCYIKDAKNIRRWGTKNGLGELAANGPTSETKADPAGTVKAPISALIHMIKCEDSKWKK